MCVKSYYSMYNPITIYTILLQYMRFETLRTASETQTEMSGMTSLIIYTPTIQSMNESYNRNTLHTIYTIVIKSITVVIKCISWIKIKGTLLIKIRMRVGLATLRTASETQAEIEWQGFSLTSRNPIESFFTVVSPNRTCVNINQ